MAQSVAIIRSIGGLVFDAVFEEVHETELEVTDTPVESGVLVSDHAYMKPRKVTITAGVSETPLYAPLNDPFSSNAGRTVKAYELLTALQKLAEPFDVQTGLVLYTNMVCTNIRTMQDKDHVGALLFTASLREVVIVSTETVTYPPRQTGATARQAGPVKKHGEQQGKDVTKQSLASKLKQAIFGK